MGRRILALEQHGPLQAVLFHVAFWRLNLAYFDGYPFNSMASDSSGCHSVVPFGVGTRLAPERDTPPGFARLP